MDTVTRVQILDDFIGFSLCAYTIVKTIIYLLTHTPAYGLIVGQTDLFNLITAIYLEKEKTQNSNQI